MTRDDATTEALLGDPAAAEWLAGYQHRLAGGSEDEPSGEFIRGWLSADLFLLRQKQRGEFYAETSPNYEGCG